MRLVVEHLQADPGGGILLIVCYPGGERVADINHVDARRKRNADCQCRFTIGKVDIGRIIGHATCQGGDIAQMHVLRTARRQNGQIRQVVEGL